MDTEDESPEVHVCLTPGDALALATQHMANPLCEVLTCSPMWIAAVAPVAETRPSWCRSNYLGTPAQLPLVKATAGQFADRGWPKSGWYFLTGPDDDPIVHGPFCQWTEALFYGNRWVTLGEVLQA